MATLKTCPRCNGNMMLEEYLGDMELVCIQCGHRLDVTPQAYSIVAKKAA